LEKFFQGFDFGMETFDGNCRRKALAHLPNRDYDQISEKLHKEFNVLKLIEGYRTRGHLFTKQIKRQKDFEP
jgi:2-oxoglutarate dehydrogenase E1 component